MRSSLDSLNVAHYNLYRGSRFQLDVSESTKSMTQLFARRVIKEWQQTAALKMHEALPRTALAASNRAITPACYLQDPQVEMVMILLNTAPHMERKWKCQQHLNYKENQIEILIR